jgi:uncharacterized caspase-like protein
MSVKINTKLILIVLPLLFACGTKSFSRKKKLIINYPSKLPALYVLSVGVSQYVEDSLKLDYPDEDAVTIAQILKDQEGRLFKRVYIKVLINEDATRGNIIKSFDFLNRASPEDMVIIFISGHGYQSKTTKSYYFLPNNANFENIKEEGLLWSTFEEGVKELKKNVVNKIILMVDTCHAGAMKMDELIKGGESVDLADLFNNMEGVFILGASKPGEKSFEKKECGHGAFTCALIDAFNKGDSDRDGILKAYEIANYVSNEVPKMTAGRQHPYQKGVSTNLPIALVRYAQVTINTIPWANIQIKGSLDDFNINEETPIVNYSLPPGKYDLVITRPGYQTYTEKNIQVKDEDFISRTIELKPD